MSVKDKYDTYLESFIKNRSKNGAQFNIKNQELAVYALN